MEKELYLAAGCFWGAEHFFKQIHGVLATETGFANGHTDRPTYQQVYPTPPAMPRRYACATTPCR